MRRMFLAVIVFSFSTVAVSAQSDKDKPIPQGTVRVAVVNIGYVFNKYERAQAFKLELEKTLDPFKVKVKKMNAENENWAQMLRNGDFTAFGKEQLIAMIEKNQTDLEEMERNVKDLLGKKQEDNLVQLWKEVQGGIKTYAIQHKIELVFGYGDPMEKEMLDLFPNVNRKMQAMDLGSTVPLFMAPGTDIAEGVADLLNKQARAKKQAKLKNQLLPPGLESNPR